MQIKQAVRSLMLAAAMTVLVATSAQARASEADDLIGSSFAKSYVYKTYLQDEKITFSSKNGMAILAGSALDETQKLLAQDLAEALPGVKSVDNRIEITGGQPARNSDAWTAMKVNNMLMFHRNVSAEKTDISVKDGIVTLRGEAPSEAHKKLTGDYSRHADGVKSVSNQMTIGTAPARAEDSSLERIDDPSVTALVKTVLRSHDTTSAINTTVATTDGVVALGGDAKSPADKTLLANLVIETRGVKRLVNQMGPGTDASPANNPTRANFVGLEGAEGPAGLAGAEGAVGATGAPGSGIAGVAGAQGAPGPAGTQGAIGATGPAGDYIAGAPGAIGPAGTAGSPGQRGATGAQGDSEAGRAGSIGMTGPQGPQGAPGEMGAKGPTMTGPSGRTGPAGPAGTQGAVGKTGAQGATTIGVAGEAGPDGKAGPQGPVGPRGATGPAGGVDSWHSYRAFWFDTTTAELRSSDMEQVSEIADYMKKNPSLKVGLCGAGRSDSTSQSKELSGRRATTVRDALIKAGVPASRIEIGALGDPLLARDQRVEVLLHTSN